MRMGSTSGLGNSPRDPEQMAWGIPGEHEENGARSERVSHGGCHAFAEGPSCRPQGPLAPLAPRASG
jgi:hypothetical protein